MNVTNYRAICPEHNYKGAWRTSYSEALNDANAYMLAHDTHVARVEMRVTID